jgi:hypothetical protein
MDMFDDSESCELVDLQDDSDFIMFLTSKPSGIKFIPEKYQDYEDLVIKKEVGPFSKWLRQNYPDINVHDPSAHKKLVLKDNDFWFPLVYLATDITLPVYLSIVSSYIYDRMKGSLSNEKAKVHLTVEFSDKKNGITKKFHYDGEVEGLQKSVKRFDLNNFMED